MTFIKDRKLNRLPGYDYSSDSLYFVTACVKDKAHYLGEIVNGEMMYNEYGIIAYQQWEWLQKQYSYILSHAFVVMPNHIHGVLEINREFINVGTGRDLSLLSGTRKIKSLSELIGAYKTTTSKYIHLAGGTDFLWQRSFYDHIIRDEKSYQNIVNYIDTNPENWRDDRFYTN